MKKEIAILFLFFSCFVAHSQTTICGKTNPVKLSLHKNGKASVEEVKPEVKPQEHKVENKELEPVREAKSYGEVDLRVDIPVSTKINDKTFVVIIANENYRREVKVMYALNDGKLFREYCEKTLGIPTRNIQFLHDATFGEIRGGISWLSQVADAYSGEARIIFYYAGHGMPNEADQIPYILPVDGFSSDFETAIKLDDLYARFAGLPALSVTVFLDACFSGTTREDGMLASARAVRVRPKTSTLQGNMVVFTSATGTETALPYVEKEQGMFTYFLLKKLRETRGDVSYQELSDYLMENVRRRSVVVNQKSQTPQINVSEQMQGRWQSLRFW